MNKTELITAVAQEAEMTKKDAEKAVKAVLDVVSQALVKGEKVQLIGFGTFEVRERKARIGHNPSTQDEIKIPASKTPAFRVSKQLKEKVNEKIHDGIDVNHHFIMDFFVASCLASTNNQQLTTNNYLSYNIRHCIDVFHWHEMSAIGMDISEALYQFFGNGKPGFSSACFHET